MDRADRLPEARRLVAALGDPRPRGRLDAAQLPLRAADWGRRSTGCGRARCGCRPGRRWCRSRRGRPGPLSTSSYMRGWWRRGFSCWPRPAWMPERNRRGSCRPRESRCCSVCSVCSACATRSRSSVRGQRSTATVLIVGLFPVQHWIVAWQFVLVFIWWGAASSKLNHHFPFVVSTMMSNAPLIRSPGLQAEAVAGLPGGHAAVAAGGAGSPTSGRSRSSSGRCC